MIHRHTITQCFLDDWNLVIFMLLVFNLHHVTYYDHEVYNKIIKTTSFLSISDTKRNHRLNGLCVRLIGRRVTLASMWLVEHRALAVWPLLIGQQLLSRHDELKEKARQLLEATKREAREKDKSKRQSSKDSDEKTEICNGVKNGDVGSPKKVNCLRVIFSVEIICFPEVLL